MVQRRSSNGQQAHIALFVHDAQSVYIKYVYQGVKRKMRPDLKALTNTSPPSGGDVGWGGGDQGTPAVLKVQTTNTSLPVTPSNQIVPKSTCMLHVPHLKSYYGPGGFSPLLCISSVFRLELILSVALHMLLHLTKSNKVFDSYVCPVPSR